MSLVALAVAALSAIFTGMTALETRRTNDVNAYQLRLVREPVAQIGGADFPGFVPTVLRLVHEGREPMFNVEVRVGSKVESIGRLNPGSKHSLRGSNVRAEGLVVTWTTRSKTSSRRRSWSESAGAR